MSTGEDAGLYRTTITLRRPANWARLEELGVVVLGEGSAQERATDQQKSTDRAAPLSVFFRSSVAILAGEDQLEALACLRFEPRSTDELGALVMAHAQAKPWLVAGVRAALERGSLGLTDLTREGAPIR